VAAPRVESAVYDCLVFNADDWGEAQCTCSLGLGYKLCTVVPVAGKQTHRTTFRALTVTSRVAAPRVESAVYDCLVFNADDWGDGDDWVKKCMEYA